MIDIHTHVLPNIDDGSKSAEETLEMIKEAYQAGFTDIITTSHYIYNGQYDVNYIQRREIINSLQKVIDSKYIDINLYNGAEAYITPELAMLYEKKVVPTLANSRYVLFELPLNAKVIYTDRVIEDLKMAGFIPIIAHPERYDFVQDNVNIALEWIEEGAYLQSNYGSIIGKYGNGAKKAIVKLLKKDAVSFLGTDCHREGSLYTEMDEMLHELKKVIGEDKLYQLNTINPEKILKDELL